jgi:uncharacterized cupredoxin-like copper-binding protein
VRRVAPALACGLLLVAAGCGDDDAGTDAAERPQLTVSLADGELSLPETVPGGLVDVVLDAADGEQSHHVVFARLQDGVTYDQLDAAADDEFFALVVLQGGNGSLAPGEQARLTLDLPAGDYQVLDLPDGEFAAAAARTTVTAPAGDAPEPEDRGEVVLGPGFAYDIPEDFDGSGSWRFVNEDEQLPHEAVLIALADGTTTDDLVEWATTFAGPPPGELIGGFGTISGGITGWADLGDHLPAGDYAVVCLLPGEDGSAHAANGMVAGFTVN